jgi:hypothetical protein
MKASFFSKTPALGHSRPIWPVFQPTKTNGKAEDRRCADIKSKMGFEFVGEAADSTPEVV